MRLCPVCKIKYIEQGLNNHIINKAKAEAYKQMKFFFETKKSSHTFSKAVVLRNIPHFAFIRRNTKEFKKFDF